MSTAKLWAKPVQLTIEILDDQGGRKRFVLDVTESRGSEITATIDVEHEMEETIGDFETFRSFERTGASNARIEASGRLVKVSGEIVSPAA